MVKVHLWRQHKDGFGHVSLTVTGGSADRKPFYVSWWPAQVQGKKLERERQGQSCYVFCASPSRTRTLEDDIRGEGRKADDELVLLTLDEQAIWFCWKTIALDHRSQWCTVSSNCSTICAKCLIAGARGVLDDRTAYFYWPTTVFEMALRYKNQVERGFPTSPWVGS